MHGKCYINILVLVNTTITIILNLIVVDEILLFAKYSAKVYAPEIIRGILYAMHLELYLI